MWQFWKDFFSLFTTKAHRTLLSLEKIEDKAFKVKQSLEASRAQLKKAQVDNQTEANVFETDIKSKKFEIAENENFLLQAAEKGNEEDVIKFNSEIATLEAEVAEYQETLNQLNTTIEGIRIRREKLDQEIDEADRVIRVAKARHRSAQAIIKANAGHLDESVYKEIEEIKRSSIELQQRAVAIGQVEDEDRKKGIKDLKAQYRNSAGAVSAQERIAALKAKKASESN